MVPGRPWNRGGHGGAFTGEEGHRGWGPVGGEQEDVGANLMAVSGWAGMACSGGAAKGGGGGNGGGSRRVAFLGKSKEERL